MHAPLQQQHTSQNFQGRAVFSRNGAADEDGYNEEEAKRALNRVYDAPLSMEGALKKERRKNGLPSEAPTNEDSESIYSWSTLKGGYQYSAFAD